MTIKNKIRLRAKSSIFTARLRVARMLMFLGTKRNEYATSAIARGIDNPILRVDINFMNNFKQRGRDLVTSCRNIL